MKPEPKKTTLGYLTGWFLVELKDHRLAKQAAVKFQVDATKRKQV